MKKSRVLFIFGLLFFCIMLGLSFRGVFKESVEEKNSALTESGKGLNKTVDQGPQSLPDLIHPSSNREASADSRTGTHSIGGAIGQELPRHQRSSSSPTTALPPGVQPSDVQISPDGTAMHFQRVPTSSTKSEPPNPAIQPVVQPVDIRVSPDGSTNYIVRLPSVSGQSQSAPLVMLPANVTPQEVELSPEGIIAIHSTSAPR